MPAHLVVNNEASACVFGVPETNSGCRSGAVAVAVTGCLAKQVGNVLGVGGSTRSRFGASPSGLCWLPIVSMPEEREPFVESHDTRRMES